MMEIEMYPCTHRHNVTPTAVALNGHISLLLFEGYSSCSQRAHLPSRKEPRGTDRFDFLYTIVGGGKCIPTVFTMSETTAHNAEIPSRRVWMLDDSSMHHET
jgi:hypothetical protein